MDKIDKIILGDNQFFGINHMSQEKAQQLAEKFFHVEDILKVYDIAYQTGIRAFMLNSHDKAREICSYFRENRNKYPELSWYPSVPYAHKYANLVAEKGILPTINEVVFKDNTAMGVLGLFAKGGAAVLGKDAVKLMQMLVDVELKSFRDLPLKAIFIQNIVTDLLLGYEVKDLFYEYCQYIRKKYKTLPGLITQNMPHLLEKLNQWGIKDVVVCSSFNKIGYLMSPDVNSYVDCSKNNNPDNYQLIAMSTLASGAIPVKEAYEFINQQKIQSVVFGASTKNHIEETIKLIKL
jgi:hypothetical protein